MSRNAELVLLWKVFKLPMIKISLMRAKLQQCTAKSTLNEAWTTSIQGAISALKGTSHSGPSSVKL